MTHLRCFSMFAVLFLAILQGDALAADKADKKEDEKKSDKKPKPYADVITKEAVTDTGLFAVHMIGEKLYFEVPAALLGRDMLLVSRVAGVPAELDEGRLAAGHETAEQVLRWERLRNRVLLRKVSYQNVASDSLPIHRSVVNNNFAPILASFEIEALGSPPAGGSDSTLVLDVTSFYLEDVPAISGLAASLRETYKVQSLDKARTFLNYARAYPLNVDVRHTLTFSAKEPPADRAAQTLSLEMHQSMVLLPDEPMRPRYADPRLGYFSLTQVNFGLEEQKAAEQTFIARWRLEPKDPEAYARGELVEPVKPIVYYLDPATPEAWRPFVRQGIEDWQVAFETAGFKNAILAKDPPSAEEDPEWSAEDVRYSVVRWAATQYRNAMGPSVWDPRTGEIIESDIVWYHNHLRTYRNRLLIETGASNPAARSLPIDDVLMGEALRQVIAHEVGHALGLPHNMIASSAYPVDSLRVPSFVKRMGVAPTVMDYARQDYIAQPGDGLEGADYIRQIGPYDHYAINWGYRVLPEVATPEEEKPILDRWIRERAYDPVYRYAPQRSGLSIDPRNQTEDLGDDPVRASGYGIASLKGVVPHLVEWTTKPGEDYSDLEELYGDLIGQWSRYIFHVIAIVGGVHETLKASDQAGMVYEPVSAEKQRSAMDFLAKEALATPEWLLDAEILGRIEHAGAVARVGAQQARVVDALLDPGRIQRLVETQSREGESAYDVVEFLDDLKRAVWTELGSSDPVDPYRRTLQRAYLERLEWLLSEEPAADGDEGAWSTPTDVSRSDVRALVRGQLMDLHEESRRAGDRARDRMTRLHWEDVVARIEEILERLKTG